MSFYRLSALVVICLLVIPGTLFLLPDQHVHPAGMGHGSHLHIGGQFYEPTLARGAQFPLLVFVVALLPVLPLVALLGERMTYNILQASIWLRPFALSQPVPPPR